MKKSLIILLSLLSFGCVKSEMPLTNSEGILRGLKELKSQPKFGPSNETLYPGAPNEIIRVRAETAINALIDSFIQAKAEDLSKSYVLEKFAISSGPFHKMDSEEMDRALTYMEEIMDIYGIESSDGMLNKIRYGFNPAGQH
ncbi:DUF4844 domain-containing protein [Pseudoalteromonas rubra]|uniref:DUF4844 domain-containing protein n=1 Tax=Pseudoalteromonas rubra TaxID=43658 RepID=UPI002DBEE984|nr:DUF4844 domain-containing protein [Pseudoalteromonas rubra]MEC4087035.1 DUF4844 domain-containing protein [Pseudoalteromonas rubra]